MARATLGILALADGTVFRGVSVGAAGRAVGEVVFNTAMTGYQEIITDKSYTKQIVALTYPHIGNTGINGEDGESDAPQIAGLVVRDVPNRPSSWRMAADSGPKAHDGTLGSWLAAHGVVGIAEIDTRRLVRILRDGGAQGACIAGGDDLVDDDATVAACIAAARDFAGLAGANLAEVVTVSEPESWRDGSIEWLKAVAETDGTVPNIVAPPYRVVAYDFGIKHNIARMLVDRGCDVTLVPATTPAREVLALEPDGVFLSNGPGDPEPVVAAQAAIRELVDAHVPTFGICLGHQLLCLALGATSTKMKFGHHGANHPVKDHDTGQVFISSQNHGFAIDAETLPDALRVTHTSLFDGSLQGVAHTSAPAFSFQGHPEASPGPRELDTLFDRFAAAMAARRSAHDTAPGDV